jgi:N-acetyl-beta-hexosaminidase
LVGRFGPVGIGIELVQPAFAAAEQAGLFYGVQTLRQLFPAHIFAAQPAELNAAQAAHVLGVQAQMWTDRHPSESQIDQWLTHAQVMGLIDTVVTKAYK